MGREEAKRLAKELVEKCKTNGVKLPTIERNAMIEAGTMLTSHKCDMEAAFEGMIEKYGAKKRTKEEKDEKKSKKQKVTTSDEDDEKKTRAKSQVLNAANQVLIDELMDLCGFEFKNEEKFKGLALSKACKSLREHPDPITSGKVAQKLKGIGKSTAAKIQQFLDQQKIDRLEEYRAGNL